MGKGAGCGASKPVKDEDNQKSAAVNSAVQQQNTVTSANQPYTAATPASVTRPAYTMSATKKIYVIFYTTYGHIWKLVEEVVKGINSVDGTEAVVFQVPETLPEIVLEKMHAPPKPDVPIIDVHELAQADGFVFAFPTRYGMPPAQFKAFMDATGQLWQTGGLVGKPVTFVTSTASQGGGQEATILTSLPFVAAHGMIWVPPGYSFGEAMFGLDEAKGGSGWGSGTFAGPTGARQPSTPELGQAEHQGKYFASKVKLLSA